MNPNSIFNDRKQEKKNNKTKKQNALTKSGRKLPTIIQIQFVSKINKNLKFFKKKTKVENAEKML